MIEQVYKLTLSDQKTVEKVVHDENVQYMHMVFNEGQGTPEHYSNSTVYMTVIRGTLSITLGEQGTKEYEAGTVLKIPLNTKMKAENRGKNTLELIVVKAPSPEK